MAKHFPKPKAIVRGVKKDKFRPNYFLHGRQGCRLCETILYLVSPWDIENPVAALNNSGLYCMPKWTSQRDDLYQILLNVEKSHF